MIRIFKLTTILLAFTLLLAACWPGTQAPTPTPSASLEFAYLASPDVQAIPPTLYYYADGASTVLMRNIRNFAWSPDGKTIAAEIVYGASFSDRAISLFDLQTRQGTLFVQGGSPSWSPDGTQIAYEVSPTNLPNSGGIFVTGLQQYNPTRKLVGLNRSVSDPTWSPDGKWIAYSDYAGSSYTFYIVNVETAINRVIADGLRDGVSGIAWSSDGTKIIFDALGDNNTDIYLADLTAGTVTDLTTDDPEHIDESASWSPDGTSILFVSFRVDDVAQIFKMKADGSDVTQLSNVAGFEPVWSPNSSEILYAKKDGSIVLMNADGSGLTPVPQVEPKAYYAKWRP